MPTVAGIVAPKRTRPRKDDASVPSAKVAKKTAGAMDSFIKAQKISVKNDVDFVIAHANRTPEGIVVLGGVAMGDMQRMHTARDAEDYDAAQDAKDKYDVSYKSGLLEIKLLDRATWLSDYAENMQSKCSKAEKFKEAQMWKDSKLAARAYLERVPDEDRILFSHDGAPPSTGFDPFDNAIPKPKAPLQVEAVTIKQASSSTMKQASLSTQKQQTAGATGTDVLMVDEHGDDVTEVVNLAGEEAEKDQAEGLTDSSDEAEVEAGVESEVEVVEPPMSQASKDARRGRNTDIKDKHTSNRVRSCRKYVPQAAAAANPAEEAEDAEDEANQNRIKMHIAKYVIEVGPKKAKKAGPPKEKSYDDFMAKPSHNVNRADIGKCSIVPAEHPYLYWKDTLWCGCCNTVVPWYQRGTHAVGKKHTRALESYNKIRAETKKARKKTQSRIIAQSLQGTTFSADAIDCQLLWLKACYQANWSLNSLDRNRSTLLQLTTHAVPDVRSLHERVPDLRQSHSDKMRELVDNSFPNFSVIMDGSPLYAEMECVIIRIIDKNFRIHQFVLHLAMYDSSLNAVTIAKNIKDALDHEDLDGNTIGLNVANWISTAMDRASSNTAAMDIVHADYNVAPLSAFCAPHGIAICGKERDLTIGEEVIKHMGSTVKYPLCQGRLVFLNMFGERALRRAGVRWGNEGEAVMQYDDIGLDRLAEFAQRCYDNKWSKESAGKLLAAIEDTHDRGVASCELAALADAAKPMISNLYTCESEQPLVLSCDKIFDDLKVMFAQGVEGFARGNNFKRLEKRATEAAARMLPILEKFDLETDRAKVAWENAKLRVDQAELAVNNHAQAPAPSVTNNNRQRRPGSRQDYSLMNRGRSASVPRNQALDDALARAKEIEAQKKEAYEDAVNLFTKFQDEHYCYYEEFIDLGYETVRPVIEKYISLFISPEGDFVQLVSAYKAARVLNPLIASEMDDASIKEAVQDLTAFGFLAFSPTFIQALVREIPAYVEQLKSTPPSVYDNVEGAAEYDKALKKKAEKDPADVNLTWKDDRIEFTRRSWKWWEAKHSKLTYFSIAARLVAEDGHERAGLQTCSVDNLTLSLC